MDEKLVLGMSQHGIEAYAECEDVCSVQVVQTCNNVTLKVAKFTIEDLYKMLYLIHKKVEGSMRYVHDSLVGEVEDLQEELDHTENEVSDLEEQLYELREKVEGLTSDLEDKKNELDEAEENLEGIPEKVKEFYEKAGLTESLLRAAVESRAKKVASEPIPEFAQNVLSA